MEVQITFKNGELYKFHMLEEIPLAELMAERIIAYTTIEGDKHFNYINWDEVLTVDTIGSQA